MQEITIQLFDFDELSEAAQERAVDAIREQLAGPWWDSGDIDDITAVMTSTLAEKLGTPGWDSYGVADFPGIPDVRVVGWDISRGGSIAVTGILTRDNAPALPWDEGIDRVELAGYRSDTTTVTPHDMVLDCTCTPGHYLLAHDEDCAALSCAPVTDEQRDDLEHAVRDALHDAWSAGGTEHDYKTGEQWAREVAANHQFTEDGAFYQ
ncbi:hypothetical protein [Actinophytocola glycyrrhizae]|uniref:Uncharacterized protein n=1 Tax=Actinophytocola glycyrrhizae TaxID=2044873 RepID=A0ABV9SFI4_9PSEU